MSIFANKEQLFNDDFNKLNSQSNFQINEIKAMYSEIEKELATKKSVIKEQIKTSIKESIQLKF